MPVDPELLVTDPNRRIHKYPLTLADHQTVYIPTDAPCAAVLHVAFQENVLCLWAEVDLELSTMPVEVFVVGTGNPMPDGAHMYLGTVQANGLVWHVYIAHDGDDEDE